MYSLCDVQFRFMCVELNRANYLAASYIDNKATSIMLKNERTIIGVSNKD